MSKRAVLEELMAKLKELNETYYNAFKGNIFELAVYLYIRYEEIPENLCNEEKLEEASELLLAYDSLFKADLNYDIEEL